MILHYKSKYTGDKSSLPQREHPENAVLFKEAKNMKQLAIIVNASCILVIILLAVPFVLLGRNHIYSNIEWIALGAILACLTLFPHELLHAICFKKDVYLYTNFKQGLLFVVGTEDMSKCRFIFMSLLPNIVFGLIPYVIFLVHPAFVPLGIFGLLCIGMGSGDYINVFNVLKQVPKGAKIYLSGIHSYWYTEV